MGHKLQAFDSKAGITRGDLWFMPPIAPTAESGGLVIIGRDTPHTRGQHRLWRSDCNDMPNTAFIDSLRKHGVLQPIRARKLSRDNVRAAEVVAGRDRTKGARYLWENEGIKIKVPVMLFSMDATDEEIIGAANAENYQRKTEDIRHVAEHCWMQAQAAGYPSNTAALQEVFGSTGVSPQRQKMLYAFRGDPALVAAYEAGSLRGEAALALTTLEPEERAAELVRIVTSPTRVTVAETRERISHMKRAAFDDAIDETPAKLDDVVHPTDDAATIAIVHPATSAPAKKTKKKPAKKEPENPGIGRHLQKRLVADQLDMPVSDRNIDQLVIKTLKVCAGLAAPSTVPGFAAAMKRLGL